MDIIEVVNLKVSTLDESDLFISTLQLLIQRHAPHRCMRHVSVRFNECMSSLERVSEDLYICLSRCMPVHDAICIYLYICLLQVRTSVTYVCMDFMLTSVAARLCTMLRWPERLGYCI
jgi:hypothetical protein